jgi:hypothetical protein
MKIMEELQDRDAAPAAVSPEAVSLEAASAEPYPSRFISRWLAWALISGTVIVCGCVLLFLYVSHSRDTDADAAVAPADEIRDPFPVSSSAKTIADSAASAESAVIQWQQPIERQLNRRLFLGEYVAADGVERDYTVGTFAPSYPVYGGCDLVVAEAYLDLGYPDSGAYAGYFADCGGTFTFLQHANPSLMGSPSLFVSTSSDVRTDPSFTIASLQGPAEIPFNGATLAYTGSLLIDYTKSTSTRPSVPEVTSWAAAFTYSGSTVYTDSKGNYYLISPDGFEARTYQLKIGFVSDVKTISQDGAATDVKPMIRWNGENPSNAEAPAYNAYSGYGIPEHFCGFTLVKSSSSVEPGDLVVAGRTEKTGEPVYVLSDADHPFMRELYEDYATTTQWFATNYPEQVVPPLAYTEFVAARPVFFWIDPLGNIDQFMQERFVPWDCGKGKPVIYLYPEHTGVVTVRIDPKGGISTSSPLYEDGWQVIATPEGEITDQRTGRRYPYLFWEAPGWPYTDPQEGASVASGDVEAYLTRTLTALGLNEQERVDFIAFWAPRLKASPYAFISFFGNDAMDEEAPLSITPQPDTIIRVFMYYRPLAAPIATQEQHFTTPVRKGFTVVEWGGVL